MMAFAGLIAGAAALVLYIVLALLWGVIRPQTDPLLRHFGGAAVAHVVVTVGGAVLMSGFPYWQSAAFFGFGFAAFLSVMMAFYKSVSLSILQKAHEERTDTLSYNALSISHGDAPFIERIELLKDTGVIEERDGRFYLTEQGQRTSAFLSRLQGVYGVRGTGVYFTQDE